LDPSRWAAPGRYGALEFKIDYEEAPLAGPIVVVRVSGEIDLAGAPAFRDVIDLAFERGSRLVVEMSDVDFINAAGVSVLVWAAARARELLGRFAVRRPSPIVRKVLGILGLEDIVDEDGQ